MNSPPTQTFSSTHPSLPFLHPLAHLHFKDNKDFKIDTTKYSAKPLENSTLNTRCTAPNAEALRTR